MNKAFKRSDNWGVFDRHVAADFQIRPGYAPQALRLLDAELSEVGSEARVADVGAGTGIFTRQLAELMTNIGYVVGIEPSASMRRVAAQQPSKKAIDYIEGSAESLPIPTKPYDLITAAMAAHRFRRSVFYDALPSVIRRGGLVAFIDNLPRLDLSGLHSAYLALQETYVPGFQRGMNTNGDTGGYFFLDLEHELISHGGFKDVVRNEWDNDFYVDEQSFMTLARSSTISLRAIEAIGHDTFERYIREIYVQGVKSSDLRLTYSTRLITARLR